MQTIRQTYAKPNTLRKALHKRAQKPYNLRKPHTIAQPVCYIRLPTNQQLHLKRHRMQQKVQDPTSWSWLEKIKKDKFTNKSRRLNGKGNALVTRGRWHARTVSAQRSNKWGFNSRQAENSHFGSSEKNYRGSTRKASDCLGFNWEQHYNGTEPVPFYPNLPRWGSATYLWIKLNWIASQNCSLT